MTTQQARKQIIAKLFDTDITEVLAKSSSTLTDVEFVTFYEVLIDEQVAIKEMVRKAKSSNVKPVLEKPTPVESAKTLLGAELTMQILKAKYQK